MVCSNLPAALLDLSAPYLQRALLEMLLLAVPAGLLGSWIVLRRLAFFTHAVGTVSFPALVLAAAWGIAPQLAALAAALGFGVAQERVARARRIGADAATGLLLVGALAAGVVLASDVYESGAGVDRLLFGSLIGLSDRDLWLTALVAAGAIALDRALRRHWLAAGFEPGSAQALGMRPVLADRLLLVGVAMAAVVALDAVGALLVAVVLVVPAATARLLTDRLGPLQLAAIALAAVEGVAAVWLADELNVGAGPALAVVGGAVFALVAAATALRGRVVTA
jgi:ABC-type Mn2+/Zn2+ transport system permease subunit